MGCNCSSNKRSHKRPLRGLDLNETSPHYLPGSRLQNGTLALLITTGILQNSAMSIAPGVYSLLMFASASLFALWVLHSTQG